MALAERLDDPQPEWEVALGRLCHAIVQHPDAFTEKLKQRCTNGARTVTWVVHVE